MITTPKKSGEQTWTWSGAGFTRQTPSEKQTAAPESSLLYKRARYYDPNTGEFISRDPLGFVDGMSQYRAYFVPGGVDPSGLVCENACSVKSFNVETDYEFNIYVGGSIGVRITIDAVFSEPCECCEYRQYIVGKPKHRSRSFAPFKGKWKEAPDKDLPSGPKGEPDLREDCVVDKWGDWECYGSKDNNIGPSEGEYYSHGDCLFHAIDTPGTSGLLTLFKHLPKGWKREYEIDISFVHRIVDVCNDDKVVAEKKLHIHESIVISNMDLNGGIAQ